MKKNDSEMEWVPSKEWVPSQIVNTPDDSKYASIVDFARDSLSELENESVKYFPELEDPKQLLHMSILGQLPYSLFGDGWKKKDMLDFFSTEIDNAIDELDQLEK